MLGLPDAYVKSVRMKDADLPNEELLVDGYPMEELQVVVGPNRRFDHRPRPE